MSTKAIGIVLIIILCGIVLLGVVYCLYIFFDLLKTTFGAYKLVDKKIYIILALIFLAIPFIILFISGFNEFTKSIFVGSVVLSGSFTIKGLKSTLNNSRNKYDQSIEKDSWTSENDIKTNNIE